MTLLRAVVVVAFPLRQHSFLFSHSSLSSECTSQSNGTNRVLTNAVDVASVCMPGHRLMGSAVANIEAWKCINISNETRMYQESELV